MTIPKSFGGWQFSMLGGGIPADSEAKVDSDRTWTKLTRVEEQYQSSLFDYGGALYRLGVSGEKSDIVIRKSSDGGRTWSIPTGAGSGVLAPGEYNSSASPIIVYKGRFVHAF